MILNLIVFCEMLLVLTNGAISTETDFTEEFTLRRSKRQSHPQYEYRGGTGSHSARISIEGTHDTGSQGYHSYGTQTGHDGTDRRRTQGSRGTSQNIGNQGTTESPRPRHTEGNRRRTHSGDHHGNTQPSQNRYPNNNRRQTHGDSYYGNTGSSQNRRTDGNTRTTDRGRYPDNAQTSGNSETDSSYVGYYIDTDTRDHSGRLRTTYGTGSTGTRYRITGSQGGDRHRPRNENERRRTPSSGSRRPQHHTSQGQPSISTNNIPTYSGSRRTQGGRGTVFVPHRREYSGTYRPVGGSGYVSRPTVQRRVSRYGDRCPDTGISISINGVACQHAVQQWPFVCYYHHNTSMECCENCLDRRSPSKPGCEYGDKAFQCRNVQSRECYYARNEQICCETCRNALRRDLQNDCRYGDKSNNCDRARQNSGLCYQPLYEERCCETCPSLQDRRKPDCPFGDHFPEFCEPFDNHNRLSLDCYSPHVSRLCCHTCSRLQQRMRINDPDCQYGDHPVRFQIPGSGMVLDCQQLMQHTNGRACRRPEVATNCCFTCNRRRTRRSLPGDWLTL